MMDFFRLINNINVNSFKLENRIEQICYNGSGMVDAYHVYCFVQMSVVHQPYRLRLCISVKLEIGSIHKVG